MKRIYKRWIAVMLTICMVFTMAPSASLAEQVNEAISHVLNLKENKEDNTVSNATPSDADSDSADDTQPEDDAENENTESDEGSRDDTDLGDTDIGDATPSDATPSDAIRVISWEFSDAAGRLTDNTLNLAMADPEHPENPDYLPGQASIETVTALLPTGVLAVVEEGEEPIRLAIEEWEAITYIQDEEETWPVGGSHIFTAQLEDGYLCEPAPAVTVIAGTASYPVWVKGVQVTSANMADVLEDNTVSYIPAAGGNLPQLRLDNANLAAASYDAGDGTYKDADNQAAVIYIGESTELVLKGENKVYAPQDVTAPAGTASYGISTPKSIDGENKADIQLIVNGDSEGDGSDLGTLDVKGGSAPEGSAGIFTNGQGYDPETDTHYTTALTITNAEVTAVSKDSSEHSDGIYCRTLTIDGSSVETTGGTNTGEASHGCGIFSYGAVDIRNSTVNAAGGASGGMEVFQEKLTIADSTVEAVSADSSHAAISFGEEDYADLLNVEGTVTVMAGADADKAQSVDVSADASKEYVKQSYVKYTRGASYGVYVGGIEITNTNEDNVLGDGTVRYDSGTSTLTLNGATITTGCEFGTGGCYVAGIYTKNNNITIVTAEGSNNVITAPGDDVKALYVSSYGIYVDNNITLSGSGTLTAKSGRMTKTATESIGIMAGGTLTIGSGTVTVRADSSEKSSDGISARTININGGEVTASTPGTFNAQKYPPMGMYASMTISINGGKVLAYSESTPGEGLGRRPSLGSNMKAYTCTSPDDANPTPVQTPTAGDWYKSQYVMIGVDPARQKYMWYTKNPDVAEFELKDADELYAFAEIVNGTVPTEVGIKQNDFYDKTVKLTADIDLAGKDNDSDTVNGNWTPINASGTLIFDGNSHTISNLASTVSSGENGMFESFGMTGIGEVKNLTLANVNISGGTTVGGIAGYASGKITSCKVSGTVSGTQVVGGIAGSASFAVKGCVNEAQISGTGTGSIGGIVGEFVYGMFQPVIQNCVNTGTVSGTGNEMTAGGIAGSNSSAIIKQCANTADISGTSYVGGIAGSIRPDEYTSDVNAEIIDCYQTGNIQNTGTTEDSVGGIAGYSESGIISRCYSTGSVDGGILHNAGGIVGRNLGTVLNAVALGVSVKGKAGSTQRISGYSESSLPADHNANYARKDMVVNQANVSSDKGNAGQGKDLPVGSSATVAWDTWLNNTTNWDLTQSNSLGAGATLPRLNGLPTFTGLPYPPLPAQTVAARPTFAVGSNSYKMPTKEAKEAKFTASNGPADVYKIYAAQTGGSALTDPAIAKLTDGSGTFKLTFAAAPTQDHTYWLSAQMSSGSESERTEIKVLKSVSTECDITAAYTDVSGLNDVKAEALTGETNKLHFALDHSMRSFIEKLPIKLQISPKAKVSSASGTVTPVEKTENGQTVIYWTGIYNFSGPVYFTVTAEDGTTKKTYTLSAEIQTCAVNYDIDGNITKISGPTSPVDMREAVTAQFQAKYGYSIQDKDISVNVGTTLLTQGTDYTITRDAANANLVTIAVAEAKVVGAVTITIQSYRTASQLTDFTIPGQVGTTTIDQTAHTVEVIMPHGTDLEKLKPEVTVSDGAVTSPASNAEVNFKASETTPVEYTVTAEDGITKQTYSVTVKIPKYSITYDLTNIQADAARPATAELNENWSLTLNANTDCTVPPQTDTANLEVQMGGKVLGSDEYSYQTGTGNGAATITIAKVTGDISVRMKALYAGKSITFFAVYEQVGATVLDETHKTITVNMPHGTDLTQLEPAITVSTKAAVSPASGTVIDFTNSGTEPKTYTVTAENGDTQDYAVSVVIPSYRVSYTTPEHVTKIQGAETVNLHEQFTVILQGDENYFQTVDLTRGGDELVAYTDYTYNYDVASRTTTITIYPENVTGDIAIVTTEYSTLAKLTNFHIANEVNNKVTDNGNTIEIEMPHGTDLTKLSPTFDLSDKATSMTPSGTEVDFSDSATTPFSYVVIAEDGINFEIYTVKVTIPSFSITYTNDHDNLEATSVKPSKAALMENPQITLKAKTGYSVPKEDDATNLVVMMKGIKLEEGTGYTYEALKDRSSAALVIKDVDGDITVYAKALSQDNQIKSFSTNRENEAAVDAVISDDNGTIKFILPHDFDVSMTALPIRLLAGEEAEVTVDGTLLEKKEITVDANTAEYWVGSYDFTKNAAGNPTEVEFSVTPADSDIIKYYKATATIPSYTVTYTAADNITKTEGEDTLQWLQAFTAKFETAENYEQQGVKVEVGSKVLTETTDYTFTYDSETRIAALTIPKEQVTDKITITPRAYNRRADLTDFHIKDEVRNEVSDDGRAVIIEMPANTNLSDLKPTFMISTASNAIPASEGSVDFSNSAADPVIYTVTAEDGKTIQEYAIIAYIPLYSVESKLTHIDMDNSTIPGTISLYEDLEVVLTAAEGYTMPLAEDTENLKITVMDGDSVKTLRAGTDYVYERLEDWSGATVKLPGTADGTKVTGDVKIEVNALSVAKAIESFTVNQQVGDTRLDETKHKIVLDMPYGTDLTALAPVIKATDSNATVAPQSGDTVDFSRSAETPVEYTVTAQNGTTQIYNATITIPEYKVEYALTHIGTTGLPDIIALKQELNVTLTAEDGFSVPESIKLVVSVDGESVTLTEGTDYSYTPDAKKDKATIVFTKDLSGTGDVKITADGESRKKQIVEFTMDNQVGTSIINEEDKTISAIVTYKTDLTKIAPKVKATDSNATVAPKSGEPKDFTDSRKNPVIYTVTSEDRSTQDYKVTITYPAVVASFDSKGGTLVAEQKLTAGEKVTKPKDPAKEPNGTEYYAFDGWYADASYATLYDFGREVPGDITLYAKWKTGYKVLSEAVNGTVATTERDDTRIFYPGETVTVKATANSGYRFTGWGTSADAALLADQNKEETTFIMPEKQVSFTASFARRSSGGGGGGTGATGGGSSNITVGGITTTPTEGGGTKDSVTVSQPGGGQASVDVTKDAAGNVVSRDAEISTGQSKTDRTENQVIVTSSLDSGLVKKAAEQAGATAQSPLAVTVPAAGEALTAQIQNPEIQSVTAVLVIPSSISGSADIRIDNIRLDKGIVESAKAAGKDITISVKNEAGVEFVSWSFSGVELKNSQTAVTDINLAVDLTPVPALQTGQQALKTAIQAQASDIDGLVITFRHAGLLPATARIKLPSTVLRSDGISTGIHPGDAVKLYYYNPQTKALEASGADTYTVDAQNYVTIALKHCSDYVLVPVRGGESASADTGNQMAAGRTHTIQSGDNLWRIARQYGCSVEEIRAANPGLNEGDLRIGQTIRIPAK